MCCRLRLVWTDCGGCFGCFVIWYVGLGLVDYVGGFGLLMLFMFGVILLL